MYAAKRGGKCAVKRGGKCAAKRGGKCAAKRGGKCAAKRGGKYAAHRESSDLCTAAFTRRQLALSGCRTGRVSLLTRCLGNASREAL
jgi:hypothetical protein